MPATLTYNWKTGINGDWGTATDWDVVSVPNSGVAAAVIDASGNTVTIGGGEAFTAGSVSLQAGTLQVNGSLTAATIAVAGGVLGLGANFTDAGSLIATSGSVLLNGYTLIQSGAVTWNGTDLTGPGTLATSGTTTITNAYIDGGLSWTNSGLVQESGAINDGISSAAGVTFAVSNQVTGTFDLTGTGGVTAFSPSSTAHPVFANAGLLEDTATNAFVFDAALNSTGTVLASSGTLELQNGGTLSGTIGGTGSGTLQLGFGKAWTTAGTLAILDGGSGSDLQFVSGGTWTDTGAILDSGNLLLGNGSGTVALAITGGASFDFTADDGNIVNGTSAILTNAGTLAKTGGTNTSTIGLAFTNSGTVDAASGTLKLTGSVAGSGRLQIEAGDTLELASGTIAGANTIALNGAGATLKLDSNTAATLAATGFGVGSRIDLATAASATASISGNTLTVTPSGGSALKFVSATSLTGAQVSTASDGSGGTVITLGAATPAVSWTFPISGDWGTASDWSTGTTIVPGTFYDVLINAAGTPSYIVSVGTAAESAHSATLSGTGATLSIINGFTLATTLAVDSGTTLSLGSGGLINGGTVIANGGTEVFAGGTLNGVVLQGPLTLSGSAASLVLVGLDTLFDTNGAGSGALSLTGANDSVTVSGSLTGAGTVSLGAGGESLTVNGALNDSGALSISGGAVLIQNGATATIGGTANNSATFNLNSRAIAIIGGDFTNTATGTLDVDTNYSSYYGTGSGGSSLTIAGTLNNSGSVLVGDTADALNATTTLTLGGLVNGSGTNLGIYGSAGYAATLAFSSGGTGFTSNGGNFQMTWTAPLTLGSSFTNSGTFGLNATKLVTINGSFTNTATGTLDVDTNYSSYYGTGSGGSSLTIAGTLNNSGSVLVGDTADALNATTTLTLGGLSNSGSFGIYGHSATILATISSTGSVTNSSVLNLGSYSILSLSNANAFTQTAGTTTVQGTLSAASIDIFGGLLAIDTTTFTNTTTLWASTGGTIDATAGSLTNLAAGILTGGVYEVDTGSTLKFASTASLTTDNATIILKGTAATIESGTTSINAELTSIGTAGILNLVSGGYFNSATGFVDSGQIQLNAGTFAAGGVGIGSTGTIIGAGTVAAIVANSGTVDATGGRLVITKGASGAGTFTIVAAAALEFDSTVASGTDITFGGTGATLRIGSIATSTTAFAGTLAAFTAGETIDLLNTTATSATIAGSFIDITLQGGGTLAYATATALTGLNLATVSDGAGGTDIIAYRIAQASPVTPNAVTLPNQHVGGTLTQALSITNTAAADGYSEALDGSVSASAPVTASGSFTGLGAGMTNSTSLVVGINTSTSGVKTGSATVSLASDGTGIDGHGTTALASQSVTVSGTVYAYASPTVTASVNFGAVRTTSTAPTQSVSIANGTTTNTYQERLRYALQAPSAGFSIASAGSGTVASGSTATETLAMAVAAAGTISGTDVVTLTSTGVGTSGLADTGLGTATVALTGTVFATAVPELNTASLNFGAVHQGATVSQAITVTNGNSGALTDSLLGGFGTVSGSYSGSGTLTALGSGQSGTLTVSMNTGTVGVDTGSAALALSSHDTALANIAVSAGPVAMTGTVYAYATPILPTTSLNFGAARVGGTVLTQALTIENGTSASAYQESLIWGASTVAPFAIAPNGGTIVAGGSVAPTVTLATGTAGNFTGSTLTVAETSTGQGTSGLANTGLASQTVTLNGKIYATATAVPSTGTLNLGVVHVGTVASGTVAVTNGATGALTDSLLLTAATASGAFGSGGSVVSGGTIAQTFTLESATSGVMSSTGTLAYASHDPDLPDLTLNAGTIALTGTIDNYATAAWEKVSGSGSFAASGTQATLNFGTVVLNATAPTVDLGALNAATGLADLMGGSFVLAGTTGFTDTGFSPFSTLAAGAADTSPTIALSTSQAGVFTETVTLQAYGTNSSGFNATLAPDILTVTGTIVQPPTGPVLSGIGGTYTITDQQTIAPFPTASVTDSNLAQTETVTAALSAAADGSLSSAGGGTYSAGVWSMIGSTATVSAALDALIFTPTAHQVAPGQTVTTIITVRDTDTAGTAAIPGSTTVIAVAGTVAPTITGTKSGQPTTGTIQPFSSVTIGDLNFAPSETTTVTLSNPANGTLSNLGGFTATGTAGVYRDTGSAATVTAALDALIFTPAGTAATTTFTIQDTDTAGAAATDSNTSVIYNPVPPFFLTPIYNNGTVELQVWANAGDEAEAADLSITVSPTAGTFGSPTGPSGWLVVSNLQNGKETISEAGASPVGTTTAGLLDTIPFIPAAGAASLSATVTVTDWTDSNNVQHGPVTLGPTIVPLDVLLSGIAYGWDSHALLSGVTVSATGSGDPAGAGQSPVDLQDVHIDQNGNLEAEVWANAGTGAGNFDATFATAGSIAANFQLASSLPANWSVVQNNTIAGTLKLAGMGLTNLTGEVELGTVTWTLPAGTTQADIALTSGDIGATAASPLSLAYGVTVSAATGAWSVTVLPGDRYDVTGSLAAGNVGNAITSADALAALKLAVGLNPNPTVNGTQLAVSPYQFIAADVTGNGVVNSADALAILKMAVGLPGAPTPTWEFLNEDETFWNPTTSSFTVTASDVPTSFVNTVSVTGNTTMNLVGVLTGDVNGSWVPVNSSGNPVSNYATLATPYFEALSAALGNVPLALWGLPTPASPLTVTASSGNDTLYASPGATLVADGNTDVFGFLAAADSPVNSPATISGFSTAAGDQIDLSAIDANDLLPGTQAFTFIGTNAFSGAAGELRSFTQGGETIIQGSTAGTGASFQIDLNGTVALQSSSFKL